MPFRLSTPRRVLALTLPLIMATATQALAQSAASTSTPASAAPGAPGKPVSAGEVVPPTGYVIGSEDVLAVVFWREKELSVDASAVRPDGMSTGPLITDITAGGLTPDQ